MRCHTCACPQCLLTMSAGLFSPFMWKNRIIFPAIASRTLWYDSALCLFVSAEWGMVELLTTDSLSPNMYVDRSTGTPRYRSVVRRSMIWSVAIRAATNLHPYVAVSTVACLFEWQETNKNDTTLILYEAWSEILLPLRRYRERKRKEKYWCA